MLTLVERSRAGDQSAFAELVESEQAAVFGTVLRLVRDRELAADVTNRAFYKAYANLASFDPSRPIRPWLVQIGAREALNELRTQRRHAAHAFGGPDAEIALDNIQAGPDPAAAASSTEQRDTIRAAVNRLPESQRIAVVLRYFADLSYAEIAELTRESTSNVGVTLLRARERLRRDLEGQGVTSDALA
jgi:RNA polymerase sigma-70 factor (ECF subfamily)